ncbi:MAG: hypothetical protein ACQESR_08880 [Planctomycetota bacterium]
MESRPTQAVLSLVGLAADKVIRDRYKKARFSVALLYVVHTRALLLDGKTILAIHIILRLVQRELAHVEDVELFDRFDMPEDGAAALAGLLGKPSGGRPGDTLSRLAYLPSN